MERIPPVHQHFHVLIEIPATDLALTTAAAHTFEGEFGEDAFANFASEPGIASEVEEGAGINAGNIVGFNVLDSLVYWDGAQAASPGDATVTIAGAGGSADSKVIDGDVPTQATTPTDGGSPVLEDNTTQDDSTQE